MTTKICAAKHPERDEYCTAAPDHIEKHLGTCRFRPAVELTADEIKQCAARERREKRTGASAR